MPLSESEMRKIAGLVVEALKPQFMTCQCGLSSETACEMGHLMGRFKDTGEGNLSKGIEEASDAIRWVIRIKRRGEKIGGAVAIALAVGIATGLGSLIVLGVRAWINGAKGP